MVTETRTGVVGSLLGRLSRKTSIAGIATAVIMGLLAITSEPWWTLRGTGSDQIVNIAVSPFYVEIQGTGLPSSVPQASTFGTVARFLLLAAALLLAWSALRPQVWWRNLAPWFATTSLTLVFLSLALMLHAVRTVMLSAYGASPPFFGSTTLQGTILGLDMSYYKSPEISASFTTSFFLALTGLAIIGGGQLPEVIKIPDRLLTSVFTRPSVKVDLRPPSPIRSLSSADEILEVLQNSLEKLTEDELALSFRKLGTLLEPGSRVSLRVPASAAPLTDRLFRLIPRAGFHLESLKVVTATPGKVENELLFEKPDNATVPAAREDRVPGKGAYSQIQPAPEEASLETETPLEDGTSPQPEVEAETQTETGPQYSRATEVSPESAAEETLRGLQDELLGGFQGTPLEKLTVDSAVAIISRFGQPVPYHALINEVYVELLNRTPELSSHKQIEKILIKHIDQELVMFQDKSSASFGDRRRWWLRDSSLQVPGPWRPASPYQRRQERR